MKKKIWLTLITLFVGGVLTACGSNSGNESASEDNGEKLSVIITFYPIYDLPKILWGKKATLIY